jgi:hypothetical protein
LAERAGVLLLSGPSADTVSVVGMVAGSPRDHAAFIIGDLICLTLEASLIDAVLADGTVLNCHIPAPEGHCVPLLDLNPFIDLHTKIQYNVSLISINYHHLFPAVPSYYLKTKNSTL